MSSNQKPSLTEEILKSKVAETTRTAGSGPSDNESKTSSDKSNSWFGGKNAWKLGLLSLTGMGILMCGNVLIMWGTLNIYIFVHHNFYMCMMNMMCFVSFVQVVNVVVAKDGLFIYNECNIW